MTKNGTSDRRTCQCFDMLERKQIIRRPFKFFFREVRVNKTQYKI